MYKKTIFIFFIILCFSTLAYPAIVFTLPPPEMKCLEWTAPTTNHVIGIPLTDLAGFKIYWKKTKNTSYEANIYHIIDNPLTTKACFEFMTGLVDVYQWYTVTSYNTAGRESMISVPQVENIPYGADFPATITDLKLVPMMGIQ